MASGFVSPVVDLEPFKDSKKSVYYFSDESTVTKKQKISLYLMEASLYGSTALDVWVSVSWGELEKKTKPVKKTNSPTFSINELIKLTMTDPMLWKTQPIVFKVWDKNSQVFLDYHFCLICLQKKGTPLSQAQLQIDFIINGEERKQLLPLTGTESGELELMLVSNFGHTGIPRVC